MDEVNDVMKYQVDASTAMDYSIHFTVHPKYDDVQVHFSNGFYLILIAIVIAIIHHGEKK